MTDLSHVGVLSLDTNQRLSELSQFLSKKINFV